MKSFLLSFFLFLSVVCFSQDSIPYWSNSYANVRFNAFALRQRDSSYHPSLKDSTSVYIQKQDSLLHWYTNGKDFTFKSFSGSLPSGLKNGAYFDTTRLGANAFLSSSKYCRLDTSNLFDANFSQVFADHPLNYLDSGFSFIIDPSDDCIVLNLYSDDSEYYTSNLQPSSIHFQYRYPENVHSVFSDYYVGGNNWFMDFVRDNHVFAFALPFLQDFSDTLDYQLIFPSKNGTLALQSDISDSLYSSRYVPVFDSSVNVSNLSVNSAFFSRVGSKVDVSMSLSLNFVFSNTRTVLVFQLPLPPSETYSLSGSLLCQPDYVTSNYPFGGVVFASGMNDAGVVFQSPSSASTICDIHFSYYLN